MQTIEIRQTTGMSAIVSIAGSEFDVTLCDPFTEVEEQSLEWYFEEWIKIPFTDETIAKRAAGSVRTYGENLFEQVFTGRAYGAYQKVNGSLSELQIVITGDPEFQGLHWEALWDHDFARPLAVDCVMVRQRRRLGAVNAAQVQESPVLNLLIVTARPHEEKDVGYRTISRPLVEAIRDAELRVNVELVRPGTYEAFVRHLEAKPEGFYHVVHFDLHGGLMTYEHFQKYERGLNQYTFQRGYGLSNLQPYAGVKAFLFFEGEEAGDAVPVTADEMAQRLQGRGIPVCILNACQSGKQAGVNGIALPNDQERSSTPIDDRETSLGARLMDAGMQMVVAMGYSVTVDAAKLLMGKVYGELFAGKALPMAIRSGRRELFDNKVRRVYFNQRVDLEDWLLPVVYGNQAVNLRLREMTFAEREDYYGRQATEYRFAGATYGFVGRDLDILKLEKALLRQGVVLLQGMGGTGKTTLLLYLREWWKQTNFVAGVFYFGYDTKAWTLEQMVFEISNNIFRDAELRQFQAMKLEAKLGELVQVLRSKRFGLMLDNLESVTGQALAIQNTLPIEEQTQIREFLARVVGGKTLVVLGSRGREEWLKSVYQGCRYELRGLDGEARSQLAKLVLERQVVDGAKRRGILADKGFERLMGLLAGYPLAIEVVLGNLARQTVGEVLAGLDAADVGLDKEGDKTESILKCVEYSHSNLSAEAQKLLLCLAPFSGFIDRGFLGNYAEELQKLEPFQDYPFEQLDGAVQEAINWGLLSPRSEEDPQLLSIQPVFPYFLKTKLAQQDEIIRESLRDGFKNHYQGLAGVYNQLMDSKDAQERQRGIFFCESEYENLYGALQICLERQESVSILFCLTDYFERTQNYPATLEIAGQVCEHLKKYPQEFLHSDLGCQIPFAFHRLASGFLGLKEYNSAKNLYQQALKSYEIVFIESEKQRRLWIATSYHQLGRVAEELREFEQARNYYLQALEIDIEFNDRYAQAGIYHQLGIVAQGLREFKQARNYYQQALQIKVEFNDRYAQASTYQQLGRVAQELREFEQARNYYQQALQIFVEFNDRYTQAVSYQQLGRVAQELREFEQARNYYLQALQVYVGFNDRYAQAVSYQQLGIVAQELREFKQARNYYQQALQIFIEFNDRYNQASAYGQLGLLAESEGNLAEARACLQTTLEIFTEFGDEHSMAIAQRNLDRLSS